MGNGKDELWAIHGTGGVWGIVSVDGHLIADKISDGDIAEHLARLHNDALIMKPSIEIKYEPQLKGDGTLNLLSDLDFCATCGMENGLPKIGRRDKVGKVWVCPGCEDIYYLKYTTGYIKSGKTYLTWTKRGKGDE